jgi:hypothetical protein
VDYLLHRIVRDWFHGSFPFSLVYNTCELPLTAILILEKTEEVVHTGSSAATIFLSQMFSRPNTMLKPNAPFDLSEGILVSF